MMNLLYTYFNFAVEIICSFLHYGAIMCYMVLYEFYSMIRPIILLVLSYIIPAYIHFQMEYENFKFIHSNGTKADDGSF
jgi:hypothetical protein